MSSYPPPPPPPDDYGQPPSGDFGQRLPPPPGEFGYSPLQPMPVPTPDPATRQVGTNKLAIASLVCSLVLWVFWGVGALVGVFLAQAALKQIKQTGEGGRGIALAGLWIGVVMFLMGLLAMIA